MFQKPYLSTRRVGLLCELNFQFAPNYQERKEKELSRAERSVEPELHWDKNMNGGSPLLVNWFVACGWDRLRQLSGGGLQDNPQRHATRRCDRVWILSVPAMSSLDDRTQKASNLELQRVVCLAGKHGPDRMNGGGIPGSARLVVGGECCSAHNFAFVECRR